jgi:hypothetical protein
VLLLIRFPAQQNCTISTIWAGNANVKQHYALNIAGRRVRDSPGLPIPNLIPGTPFTTADVTQAKALAAAAALAPQPVPVPQQQPIPQQQPNILAPTQQNRAYVSTKLHDFWPPLS